MIYNIINKRDTNKNWVGGTLKPPNKKMEVIEMIVTEKMLEIIEELGKLPVSTIDNLGETMKELRKKGYISYLDESTDYLIVEKSNELGE